MNRDLWWIIGILAGLAILAAAAVAVAALLVAAGTRGARRTFDRWLTPDPAALHRRVARLRIRHPGLDNDALVARVINDQAWKAGLVGALTGVGGIVTLPIAIPIDFALSARLQASTIHFIAQMYAPDQSPDALRLQTYAIMAGSRVTHQAMEMSNRMAQAVVSRLIRRLLAETAAEALLEVVPLIGAVVGFTFNMLATRAMGRFAVKWYRGQLAFAPHPLPPVEAQKRLRD